MYSEKEQLEFAAKARSLEYLKYHNPGEFSTSRPGLLYGHPNEHIFIWNPYLDSHQAVDLSVILKISIKFDAVSCSVQAYWCEADEQILIEEKYVDDESAFIAFKAAIVNVAAEIGRRLQLKADHQEQTV